MSAIVKESTMICPAKETPRHTIWLSIIDITRLSLYTHMPVLCIYTPNNSHNRKNPNFFDTQILKESLSRVLVPFYPLAGRLTNNKETGRIDIDCNAKGVLFVEAEASQDLVIDDLINNSELKSSFVPKCDYSQGISSFPILMIQVTRFKCGGVCIGLADHHYVADGYGYGYFYESWGRFARGVGLSVEPSHERRPYLSPRDPPQVKFEHLEFEPPLPPLPPLGSSGEMTTTQERLFKFSQQQINTLVLQVESQFKEAKNSRISTYEVLAAHVWRSVCKARGFIGDQYVKLYIPMDVRSRLEDPALPKGFFGNIIFFAACKAKAIDVTCKPLWYVVSKVQQELIKFKNSNYLRSALDYMESQSKLTTFVRGAHSSTSPNLSLNSWTKLPYIEGDFGWGKPKLFCLGKKCNEGQAFFLPSQESDNVLLNITLFSVHMPLFEKYLYEFENHSSIDQSTIGSEKSSCSPTILSKI